MQKTIASAVLVALGTGAATSDAASDPQAAFFLAYSRGKYVDYIAGSSSGRDVTGYLETIHASATAPDGLVRKQSFAKRNGGSLVFGETVASATSSGYVISVIAPNGEITQVRLLPASARAVNAAIIALSADVSHARIVSNRSAASAELRVFKDISAQDSARLSRAQSAIEAAASQLSEAQRTSDHLSAVARQARLAADTAVDKPGVSFAQNQSRLSALRVADAADQAVVIAQHTTDAAGAAVGTARAEVDKLRVHLADLEQRARALAAHLSTGDVSGR